jgi:hypothetical protein
MSPGPSVVESLFGIGKFKSDRLDIREAAEASFTKPTAHNRKALARTGQLANSRATSTNMTAIATVVQGAVGARLNCYIR